MILSRGRKARGKDRLTALITHFFHNPLTIIFPTISFGNLFFWNHLKKFVGFFRDLLRKFALILWYFDEIHPSSTTLWWKGFFFPDSLTKFTFFREPDKICNFSYDPFKKMSFFSVIPWWNCFFCNILTKLLIFFCEWFTKLTFFLKQPFFKICYFFFISEFSKWLIFGMFLKQGKIWNWNPLLINSADIENFAIYNSCL